MSEDLEKLAAPSFRRRGNKRPKATDKPVEKPAEKLAEASAVRRWRAAPKLRSGLPPLGEPIATVLAGVAAGAALLLGGVGSRTVCGAAEGCTGLGLPLALMIGALAILLGWVVLRLFRVQSAGTVTVLGGSALAVVAMLLPASVYDAWWTELLLPVIGAAAYLAARWLTAGHIDRPTSDTTEL